MHHLQRLQVHMSMRLGLGSSSSRLLNTCTTQRKVYNICYYTTSSESHRPLHHEWIVDGKVSNEGVNVNVNANVNVNGQRVVLFLHGLLGSGKNLRTLAKKFTLQTGMTALLLDLRGHGRSNGTATGTATANNDNSSYGHVPPHSIKNCSMDVIHTAKCLNLVGDNSPIGIVGHSFGGRTALSYHHTTLQQQQQRGEQSKGSAHANASDTSSVLPPEQCWILDSCPGHAHSSVANVIQAVSSIPMPVNSKKELIDALLQQNISKAIALWMTTNLQPASSSSSSSSSHHQNGFEWMFDLNVAKGILDDFPKQDMFQLLRDCTAGFPDADVGGSNGGKRIIHKVIAKKNGSWSKEILQELQDIQREANEHGYGYGLNMLTLDAGHWVHIDALDDLLAAMTSNFNN